MTEPEYAVLTCTACDETVEHELRYVGRLLQSATCENCGHVLEITPRNMVPAYLQDLEQRLVSKPRRLRDRARRDPVGFVRALPQAALRQPAKLVREVLSIVRR
jgi:hypothetical protein